MYKHIVIDPEQNMLLCNTPMVGKGELVEVYAPDDQSPPQALGRILKKVGDPGLFEVHATFDGHEGMGNKYQMGERCVLRVLLRNMSGIRRRKFAADERLIVNTEKDENFKERKINRAKTGSVRKKRLANTKARAKARSKRSRTRRKN